MKSFATFLALAFITGSAWAEADAPRPKMQDAKNSARAEHLSRMPAAPPRLSQPMFRLDSMRSSLLRREQ
jgi:hypothetical protein